MTITLFVPCFMDACFPQAAISMVRVLEKLGLTIEFPAELACCGQPPFNSGYWDEARKVARPVLRRLATTPVASCTSRACPTARAALSKQCTWRKCWCRNEQFGAWID